MSSEKNTLSTINSDISIDTNTQGRYFNSVADAFLAQTGMQNIKTDISVQNKIGIVLPVLFARTKLSLLAERIIHAVLSMIKPTDLPNRVYRFGIDRFCEVYGLKSDKNYEGLRAALRELRDDVELPIGQGRGTGWISTWQLTDSEIQITFDPALLPLYQKELSGRYKLINVKNFVYAYTFKMYELFTMQLKGRQSCVFEKDLAELKDWLQVSLKYKSYADFKRRVLDPVVSDINGVKFKENSKINSENNMCNINVSYEEIRKGRSVLALKFTVTTIREDSPDYEKISIDPFFEDLTDEGQQAYTILRDYYHVARSTIVNCVRTYSEQTMIDITIKLQNKFLDEKVLADFIKKGGKLGAYAATCLRNGNTEGRKVYSIGDTTIDVIAVDAERKAVLTELEKLGLNGTYIQEIKFDAGKPTDFLKYVLNYYKHQVEGGKNLNAGWIRSVIENGLSSFEVQSKEQRLQEEKATERLANMSVEEKEKLKKVAEEMAAAKQMYEANQASKEEESVEAEKRVNSEKLLKEAIIRFVPNRQESEELKRETLAGLQGFSRSFLENRFNCSELENVELVELLDESAFYSQFAKRYVEKYGEPK